MMNNMAFVLNAESGTKCLKMITPRKRYFSHVPSSTTRCIWNFLKRSISMRFIEPFRENWKNSKLCENTPPCGRRVSTQFLVFPISTHVHITVYQHGKNVLYFFYNIVQRTSTKEWREIFRVDIELYQHGS